MATIDELREHNAALREKLTALRSQLPAAQVAVPDDHLTIDEAGEALGLTARAARDLLSGRIPITTDGIGPEIVAKAEVLQFIALRRQGGDGKLFM